MYLNEEMNEIRVLHQPTCIRINVSTKHVADIVFGCGNVDVERKATSLVQAQLLAACDVSGLLECHGGDIEKGLRHLTHTHVCHFLRLAEDWRVALLRWSWLAVV